MIERRRQLALRLVVAVQQTTTLLDQWMHILLHPEFDLEPELRNNSFYILICGLYDNAQGGDQRIASMAQEATEVGSFTGRYYVDLISKFRDGVLDLLSLFSVAENIWIRELRNQAIHGELSTWNAPQRSLAVVDNREVRVVQMSRDEWWQAFREYRFGRVEQDATGPLRRRFMYHPSLFWDMAAVFRTPDMWRVIKEDIQRHEVAQPQAVWEFHNDSYWETSDRRREHGPALISASMMRSPPDQRPPPIRDTAFP